MRDDDDDNDIARIAAGKIKVAKGHAVSIYHGGDSVRAAHSSHARRTLLARECAADRWRTHTAHKPAEMSFGIGLLDLLRQPSNQWSKWERHNGCVKTSQSIHGRFIYSIHVVYILM